MRAARLAAFLLASVLDRGASAALAVLLGLELSELTHDPLDLGWLGLARAGSWRR